MSQVLRNHSPFLVSWTREPDDRSGIASLGLSASILKINLHKNLPISMTTHGHGHKWFGVGTRMGTVTCAHLH